MHDPDKVVVVFDHDVPASNRDSAAMHVRGREFARRFGIERVHDVGPDQGISHVVVAENAYALPGTVMACSDSHTCSAGALNCAARGLGAPDLLYALTTGKTWFRVGETVRYDLDGASRPGVSTKDLFLHIAGTYGDHANQNVEFGGTGPARSLDRRAPHPDDDGRRAVAPNSPPSSRMTCFSTTSGPAIRRRSSRNTPIPTRPMSPAAASIWRRCGRWWRCPTG